MNGRYNLRSRVRRSFSSRVRSLPPELQSIVRGYYVRGLRRRAAAQNRPYLRHIRDAAQRMRYRRNWRRQIRRNRLVLRR